MSASAGIVHSASGNRHHRRAATPLATDVARPRDDPAGVQLDFGPLDFGRLRIDTDVREVVLDEHVVELTRLEFDLLAHMAGRPRHVFSRGDLLAEVCTPQPTGRRRPP